MLPNTNIWYALIWWDDVQHASVYPIDIPNISEPGDLIKYTIKRNKSEVEVLLVVLYFAIVPWIIRYAWYRRRHVISWFEDGNVSFVGYFAVPVSWCALKSALELEPVLDRVKVTQDRLGQEFDLQRLCVLTVDVGNPVKDGLRLLEDGDSHVEILAALQDFVWSAPRVYILLIV